MSGDSVARIHGRRHLRRLAERYALAPELRREAEVVSLVLPFRVSEQVVEELVDWSDPASDPIYRLTFPRRGMLEAADYAALEAALDRGASAAEIEQLARDVRRRLNPDPSGQHELNVPRVGGQPLAGTQHKYADTVLYFPAEGQTCHAFCSYCFRWPQFVPGQPRFSASDPAAVADYVRRHPAVTDVLVTGGDPLVMRASVLRRHLEPFLAPDLERLALRIGTKALTYHPDRFLTDRDADELMALFAELASTRALSVMAHYTHPRELEPDNAQRALARVLATGASVRCQAPLLRGVNDDPITWAELWRREVRAGAIPYYMFVERDTGARAFFEVPLARTLAIYTEATASTSGLAHTARGPVMSARPGKVLVDGVASVGGAPVFVLKLIRSREPEPEHRIELARFDPRATWLDHLEAVGRPGSAPFGEALVPPAQPVLAGPEGVPAI
jgi:L-lysine 2,3-aminomutase